MGCYNHIAMRAQCLAQQQGRAATLRNTVPGSYDPTTGVEGAPTITDYDVSVVQLTAEQAGFDNRTVIEQAEMFAGLSALDTPVAPDVETDTLVIDGVVWSVLEVNRKFLGDTTISYQLRLVS